MRLNGYELGDPADFLHENNILRQHHFKVGVVVPEGPVPRLDGTDPIDMESVATMGGYSLTMLGGEELSVDPSLVNRLKRIPAARFPQDDLSLY